MPNRNFQKLSLLTCSPMISVIPTMPTIPLHCKYTLRCYHILSSSQELKFSTTQSIGTPLVDLIMSSMNPFAPPREFVTNGKLGPKLECTWDELPYTTMREYWFSTATMAYSSHNYMCTMTLYSQLPNSFIHHHCGR